MQRRNAPSLKTPKPRSNRAVIRASAPESRAVVSTLPNRSELRRKAPSDGPCRTAVGAARTPPKSFGYNCRNQRNNRARRLEPELSEPANNPDKKSDRTPEQTFRFLLRSEPARRLIRAPKPRQHRLGKRPRGWEHPASAVSLRHFRRVSYTVTTEYTRSGAPGLR